MATESLALFPLHAVLLPGAALVLAGVALYHGGSGQEQVVSAGEQLDMMTTVGEVHGQVQIRGLDIRGLFAQASVDEAGRASLALRLPLTAPIAETMQGGYVQVGYNVLTEANTVDELGKLIVSKVQMVPGITRTLTCSVVRL